MKLIIAAMAWLGMAAAASAQVAPHTHTHKHSTAAHKPTTAAADAQARKAVRDPVTGKLRAPTDEELEAERAQRKARGQTDVQEAAAPVEVRQHADGMLSAVLGPEHFSTLKAQRRPDGTLAIHHDNAPAHRAVPKQQPSRTATAE
jgi:hypothetical protein